MILSCARFSIGICVTCSLSSSIMHGRAFWDGIGSLTLDARRNFNSTIFLLPRNVCICPITVVLVGWILP